MKPLHNSEIPKPRRNKLKILYIVKNQKNYYENPLHGRESEKLYYRERNVFVRK